MECDLEGPFAGVVSFRCPQGGLMRRGSFSLSTSRADNNHIFETSKVKEIKMDGIGTDYCEDSFIWIYLGH